MSCLLEVQNATKLFGGVPAINNVSLQVQEGEILGMIGPNGAGKTTLFNLIAGYHFLSSGKIIFNDTDISDLVPSKICKKGIARTFQVVKPFGDMTVLENTMIGTFCRHTQAREASKKALQVLEFIELSHLRDTPAKSLTIADRKRLEFARALATEPKILMLDEVMAGLRPSEIDETLGLIRKVRDEGITIILVEHIMKVIMSICERIVVLDHGELIAEGTPTEISQDPTVIEAYLGKEAGNV